MEMGMILEIWNCTIPHNWISNTREYIFLFPVGINISQFNNVFDVDSPMVLFLESRNLNQVSTISSGDSTPQQRLNRELLNQENTFNGPDLLTRTLECIFVDSTSIVSSDPFKFSCIVEFKKYESTHANLLIRLLDCRNVDSTWTTSKGRVNKPGA